MNRDDPTSRAYLRSQRHTVESALKVARWDVRGAQPRDRPTNYLDSALLNIDPWTRDKQARVEEDTAEREGGLQRRLGDYPAEADA